ncbi:glucosaminidase domain-containing protein [Aureibaculum sp. 2210JD6-5]|uniref:glucosaminidase domain-containing protein n=1 Tax=Aureibaculum sp. 2210JD6-5 TaxID=3103957 RepID=UPI002AACCCA3|nr:glucosaminidase domain-containing protein [Aureibaculum sp. 2210JD6-5]MDY7395240.1 glucosaminidase domain-containing protein [Aureibaculum sp. 2210JD6-5]
MRYLKIFLCISIISFLVSCGSHKRTTSQKYPTKAPTNSPTKVAKKTPTPVTIQKIDEADIIHADLVKRKPNLNESTLAYIDEYNDIAILEMIAYKIPASITLAQGILESNSGRSRLSVKGNNHFGIKCHSSWNGKRMYHDDDARQECFRKYEHPLTSFRDHSLFLFDRKRYAGLFELRKKDYKGWSKGLKKAGYATDPKYPAKLITLIETYELDKYDDFDESFLYNGKVIKKTEDNISAKFVIVAKGDTLYSLARNNNLTVDKLKWLNGLKNNDLSVGQKIYIE